MHPWRCRTSLIYPDILAIDTLKNIMHRHMHEGESNNPSPRFTKSAVSIASNQQLDSHHRVKMIKPTKERMVVVGGLPVEAYNATILSSHQWFGKFGGLESVLCDRVHQCASVVFHHELSAMKFKNALDLAKASGLNVLQTGFGAFCNYFLNGMKCQHRNCQFMHSFPERKARFPSKFYLHRMTDHIAFNNNTSPALYQLSQ